LGTAAEVAVGIGLEADLLVLISCKPNPNFSSTSSTSSTSNSTDASATTNDDVKQLLQAAVCSNPPFLLRMGVSLDPTLSSKMYRCVS